MIHSLSFYQKKYSSINPQHRNTEVSNLSIRAKLYCLQVQIAQTCQQLTGSHYVGQYGHVGNRFYSFKLSYKYIVSLIASSHGMLFRTHQHGIVSKLAHVPACQVCHADGPKTAGTAVHGRQLSGSLFLWQFIGLKPATNVVIVPNIVASTQLLSRFCYLQLCSLLQPNPTGIVLLPLLSTYTLTQRRAELASIQKNRLIYYLLCSKTLKQ